MFVHFTFADGSNPYICTSGKRLFHMIKKYYLEQTDSSSFNVLGNAQLLTAGKKLSAYQANQAILRDFAVEWQYNFQNFDLSMSECAEWADFFREYGKKYGLLREFEENGII